jgi:heme/copper-type cytochrome/quinol oxidase subunit 2
LGYAVNVDNFGIQMIIAVTSMFTSMGVASLIGYFVVNHQIAEKSSDLESNIFIKIKILLIILTSLILSSIVGFVLSNDETKIDKTNTVNSKIGMLESSTEYLLYNCQYYYNDKEEMPKFKIGKLKISKDKIEIPLTGKDYKDPTKETKGLLELQEDCSIDYKSQFFACKIDMADNNETRSTEISFDGNKNFLWKTMTQSEYSKFTSKYKTLLKCDAKKL